MLPALLSAKKLGITRLYLPNDCSFPIEKLPDVEFVFVEHLTMGRKPRNWNPDRFYHIVSRRNHRNALFLDNGDYKTFLHMLTVIHKKYPFELPCYCLMTNHYHFMIRSKEQSISKIMSLLNKRYADYYNTKYR